MVWVIPQQTHIPCWVLAGDPGGNEETPSAYALLGRKGTEHWPMASGLGSYTKIRFSHRSSYSRQQLGAACTQPWPPVPLPCSSCLTWCSSGVARWAGSTGNASSSKVWGRGWRKGLGHEDRNGRCGQCWYGYCWRGCGHGAGIADLSWSIHTSCAFCPGYL